MKELTKLLCVLLSISFMLIISCKDNQILNEPENDDSALIASVQTRAVNPYDFDWENADWMPTPPGQSPIPSPWVGQGSLVSIYGLDVVNDRKASDGWVLMYNSFDPNASGPLTNPYFVLYNKYRGLMRIFLYTTTQFYAPSSYLQDGFSIISNYNTSLLNFIGKEIVDISVAPTKSYSQIQPKPSDGSYPLGSNKWYMMQYELAYDPNLVDIPYNQIQFNWSLSSYNITQVNLGGGINGTIEGTIGSASSTSSNVISELRNVGTTAGKGVLAGVGQKVIENNTINEQTGENKLKLPKSAFKALSTGINSALSAASGNIPGAAISILNAIIGGTGSGPTAASFGLEAEMTLTGTETNAGSFPSTPISFWVPGTNIPQDAIGFIPLYNKNLGVLNFNSGAPGFLVYIIKGETYENPDPYDGQLIKTTKMQMKFPDQINYSSFLLVNPEVENSAQVNIIGQGLVVRAFHYSGNPFDSSEGEERVCVDCTKFDWEEYYPRPEFQSWERRKPEILECGVRFTIEIIPNDGSPKSVIYKTFKINHQEVLL